MKRQRILNDIRARILHWSRQVNRETGKPYTLRQIGLAVGISAPTVSKIINSQGGRRCPRCHQPLVATK